MLPVESLSESRTFCHSSLFLSMDEMNASSRSDISLKLHGRSADDDERVRMRGEVLFELVESFYHSVFSSSLSVAIWMRGSVAPFSEM